jgi:hypothetical protein
LAIASPVGTTPVLIKDTLQDLFVEGQTGTQGRGAAVQCGRYLQALRAKPVRARDILIVYARHLRVQKICDDAESAFPPDWEKLAKNVAKATLFKDLANKYATVDGPEQVYAFAVAAANHPEGEEGVAAEKAEAMTVKARNKATKRLESEKSNKGIAMLAQSAAYKAGVEATTTASMLTPAEKKIARALRDPLKVGHNVIVSPDMSPNMNEPGGHGIVKDVSSEGGLTATVRYSECDGGRTEKGVPVWRIDNCGDLGFCGYESNKRARAQTSFALPTFSTPLRTKKPKVDVFEAIRKGKQGGRKKGYLKLDQQWSDQEAKIRGVAAATRLLQIHETTKELCDGRPSWIRQPCKGTCEKGPVLGGVGQPTGGIERHCSCLWVWTSSTPEVSESVRSHCLCDGQTKRYKMEQGEVPH